MTTHAALDRPIVEVDPGAEATCALELRNDGDVVESYELAVLGDPAAWTVLEPPAVSVYPGDAVRITVRFSPTRDGRVAAGDVPFGVQVTPSLYPDAAVVPEGVVRVSPYTSTTAEVRPHTSAARRTGRHLVAVDNRGNVPLAVVVSGTDPDDAVKVTGRPATVAVGPGQAGFAKVRVRHRRRRWRGEPVSRPFQVVLTPQAPEQEYDQTGAPLVLDATAVQLPVVPRGAGKVLAALVALALLGAGLWFGVLKPAVTAAAEEAVADAVQEPLSEVAAEAGEAAEAAEQAQSAADALAPLPGAPATPSPDAGDEPATGAAVQRHRFETVVAAGATVTSDPLTAPEDASLAVTDVVLQNPQGDTGRLDILVDGVAVHTEALQNFRSVDYHFVTPIEVLAGESMTVRTSCVTPGPALAQTSGTACRVFVLAVGYGQPAASPEPSPVTAP